ncbi:hypothetical protein M378DRAFT_796546 [Amanita muscaria Koide BX008]|uniref:Uncharacterized protein n=1 Tax=Amanita muscaria (strain Koide BX008) TaxID=946122 RepID=A0A0C2WLB0_AMAMK|nr:hypothetical protein M378DRAFT_796546 [Amanita muscaria Koide BX008]
MYHPLIKPIRFLIDNPTRQRVTAFAYFSLVDYPSLTFFPLGATFQPLLKPCPTNQSLRSKLGCDFIRLKRLISEYLDESGVRTWDKLAIVC